jgi:hypothetical protein
MRRQYVQDPDTGELIPKERYVPKRELNPHYLVIGDRHYDGLQATDGTDISTRTKHREYMKANNLTLMDDFKGTWQKSREQRDAYFKEGKGGATRREDVARAIATLERMRNHRR